MIRKLLLGITLFLAAQVQADGLNPEDVLSLVNAKKILPLQAIIERHSLLSESTLLELQLIEEENGVLVYEFELLRAAGQVVEIEINAATAEIMHEEFEE